MQTVDETLITFPQKYPFEQRFFAEALPNSSTPGFSPIYRSSLLKNGPLVQFFHPEVNTLAKLFAYAVKNYGNDNCLGRRKFHNTRKNDYDNFFSFYTYKEIETRKNNIASGIVYLVSNHTNFSRPKHLKNGKPDFLVSILSPNRLEWLLVDIATRDHSLPNTALYPTLGQKSSKFILELTESPILFLNKDQIPKILGLKSSGNLPDLFILVSFDEFNHADADLFTQCKKTGITLLDFKAVEKTGERNPLPANFNPPTPDTLYTISFTSGTTGNPKGVVLTHGMAASGIFSMIYGLQKPVTNLKVNNTVISDLNKDDNGNQITTLCSLPLAHIYERQVSNWSLFSGFAVCMLTSTDPRVLFNDIKTSKPHILCTVPRIWNRLETMIQTFLKTNYGPNFKLKHLNSVDKFLIQNLLRKVFGLDNLKYGVNGSAPLSLETINYLKDHLSIGLGVAYGSTESFAAMLYGDPFEINCKNSSGPPALTTEIKLREVPEMGYSPKDKPMARGELMLRGPQIFQKYYKNKEATEASFTKDGWFYTGDIAAVDKNGNVYIIDRVKNFFKLSQGEYVTPEKVENIYLAKSPLLTQIFVHGDSLKNYLVGVAGIVPESIISLLKTNYNIDVSKDELLSLLKDPKFKKVVLTELNSHVRESDLQGFEKLHNLHFDFEPLKIEDEVLTPTLKLKRNNARKKFHGILKQLYEEGSLVKNSKL